MCRKHVGTEGTRCYLPKDDQRLESRRIEQRTIEIVGRLKPAEKRNFLAKAEVTSLDRERSLNRSLALLRAEIIDFTFERKTDDEFAKDAAKFEALYAQADLFNTEKITPYRPCRYSFKYRYRTDDGARRGTCQDWEVEATFYNWSREYGEKRALDMMCQKFGVEYPRNGMLLAMGTHSLYPDRWLINGIIRLDPIEQFSLI